MGYGRGPRFGNGYNGWWGGRSGMTRSRPGAFVAGVVAGGPAEKAGIVHGDVILSVDGTAVDADKPLGDIIAAKKVGDTVTLSVRSPCQAQPHDVQVTLDKNADKDTPRLGIQYTLVGPGMGRPTPGFGRGAVAAGAFVEEVSADSPADKAGIKTRDIITKVDGAAVTDPQQVVDAVGKHKPGDSIPVTVTRTDGTSADLTVVLAASPSDATKAYMGVSMSANGFRRQGQPPQPRGGDGSMTGADTPTL